jgi:glucuronosyltransferase
MMVYNKSIYHTGQPNAKLFISHGGLIGLQEAIYHAVPVLGIPFGNDQRTNLAKAQKEGYVLKLDWDEISENVLHGAIQKLLDEPR